MSNTIRLRRGSASAWFAANTVLSEGEIGIELDTNQFKIGTGTASWSELNYFGSVNISEQTSASYTIQEFDFNNLLEINNASENFIIIPDNSSTPILIGTKIDILQTGEGQTTIVPASGVALNSKEGNTKLTGQWSAASLVKRGTDSWVLIGDLSA